MNKREKTIFGIAITIGMLVGCLFGLIYQQERIINGVVELGESITGNTIIIDINETVLMNEAKKAAIELQDRQQPKPITYPTIQ